MSTLTPRTPEERYGPALRKVRQEMPERDPLVMAEWAGVRFIPEEERKGYFEVPFLGVLYRVRYPSAEVQGAAGEEPPISTRLILLHYLLQAAGAPMADRWIAFRDLPGGLGYDAAFQQRATCRLNAAFGERLEAFPRAARAIGGIPLDVGDVAYAFDVLPRVRMAVVLYRGDEEFPSSANVIYDGAADKYLPTEDLAVMGEILASRLIHLAGESSAHHRR